jgi:hypothetical protein
MKKEFHDYLTSLDMGVPLQDRAASIHDFYTGICPEEISSILVTDFISGDGQRIWENLLFFSDTYCMEAKLFAANAAVDNFDIAPIKTRIHYIVIVKSDYNFKKADDKSRMQVQFNFGNPQNNAVMRAAKQNCDHLRDIIRKYVLANLVK